MAKINNHFLKNFQTKNILFQNSDICPFTGHFSSSVLKKNIDLQYVSIQR